MVTHRSAKKAMILYESDVPLSGERKYLESYKIYSFMLFNHQKLYLILSPKLQTYFTYNNFIYSYINFLE